MAGKKSNRPDSELKINRSVTITRWKFDKLNQIAKDENKSLSQVIENGIDLLLDSEIDKREK